MKFLNFLVCTFLFVITFLQSSYAQQEVQFSQYIFNGLALNPAYAGYKEYTNLHLMYRSQWTGLQGAPQTFSASIDGVTRDRKMGLGLQVISDNLGAQSNTTAFASYAYRLTVGEEAKLSLGISAGIAQYSISSSKLSVIDPESLSGLDQSVIHPDINFGVFYASQHYFWGISGNDLLSSFRSVDPSYLTVRRARHYYAQAGALYFLSEDFALKPSFLIKEDFKGPTNLDLNLFLLIGRQVWLGASYRTGIKIFTKDNLQSTLSNNDAISALVEFNFAEHWRIGYAFDYSTTRIQNVSSGSHEISIGYKFNSGRNSMLTPRYF